MTTALRWRPIVSRVGLLALAAGVLTTTLAADSKAPAEWTNDLSPIAAADWNYARAAHLLERAGFGAHAGGDRAPRGDDAAAGRRRAGRLRADPTAT